MNDEHAKELTAVLAKLVEEMKYTRETIQSLADFAEEGVPIKNAERVNKYGRYEPVPLHVYNYHQN